MTNNSYIFGVLASYLADNRNGNPDDYCEWFDTMDDAISFARKDASESGYSVQIMKYYNDAECAWDAYITVDPDGKAWSDDENVRIDSGLWY